LIRPCNIHSPLARADPTLDGLSKLPKSGGLRKLDGGLVPTLLIPDEGQHFPFAEDDQVAAVALVVTIPLLTGDDKPPGPQLPQVQAHKYRPIHAVKAERGQEQRLVPQEGKRAALHTSAGADARLSEHEDCAGNQRSTGEVTDVAANRDQAAPH